MTRDNAVTVDGFDLPRVFWNGFDEGSFKNFMHCNGRLTPPEREHLWAMLRNDGEPPAAITVEFGIGRVLELFPLGSPPVSPDDRDRVLLATLRTGTRT